MHLPIVGMGCMNSSCLSLKRMVVLPAPSSPRVTTRISILGPMWTRLSWNNNILRHIKTKSTSELLVKQFFAAPCRPAGDTVMEDSVYLGEGDRDASVQLNVICQLCELMLLLLKRLQQTVDLLLRQHHPAVILQQERSNICQRYHYIVWVSDIEAQKKRVTG